MIMMSKSEKSSPICESNASYPPPKTECRNSVPDILRKTNTTIPDSISVMIKPIIKTSIGLYHL